MTAEEQDLQRLDDDGCPQQSEKLIYGPSPLAKLHEALWVYAAVESARQKYLLDMWGQE